MSNIYAGRQGLPNPVVASKLELREETNLRLAVGFLIIYLLERASGPTSCEEGHATIFGWPTVAKSKNVLCN